MHLHCALIVLLHASKHRAALGTTFYPIIAIIGVKMLLNGEGAFLWNMRLGAEILGPALFLLVRLNHLVKARKK